MKAAIFYKTKIGATKIYAQWLKEELDCDLIEFKEAKKDDFLNHELIIVSSGTYASFMPLNKFLKKKWKTKKIL